MFLKLKLKQDSWCKIDTECIKNIQDLINVEQKIEGNIIDEIEKVAQKKIKTISIIGIMFSIIALIIFLNVNFQHQLLLMPILSGIGFSIMYYEFSVKKEIERIKEMKENCYFIF